MIVQPAPNFGAAGNFLAALYSLDFTKDLSQLIPTEGTWQGDRKKAASLYIDNFNNNMSITIISGNYSSKIPPYSAAFINLKGFNDITLTADSGSGVCPCKLSTQNQADQIISRGNAPASQPNYPKYVNLTSSNVPVFTTFDTVTGYIVTICKGGLFVFIDPVTLKVISSAQLNNSQYGNISSAVNLGGGRIIVAASASFIIFNTSSATFTVVVSPIPGTACIISSGGFDYSPSENKIYYIKYGTNGPTYALYSFVLNTSQAYSETQISTISTDTPISACYCPDDGMIYTGMSQYNNTYAMIKRYLNGNYVGQIIPSGTYASGLANLFYCQFNRTMFGIPNGAAGPLYGAPIDNFTTAGLKNITLQGTANSGISGAVSRNTKQVYMATLDMIDTILNGSLGLLPSIAANDAVVCLNWVPNINMVAIGTKNGLVNFIN